FLDDGSVRSVWVEDPFIRSSYQIENFSHFCEVLLSSSSLVRNIYLTTGCDQNNRCDQLEKLNNIKNDLAARDVILTLDFSSTLHDREIRFDNGWIVKIGRGLDFIRRSDHKFHGLGVHDYNFRQCLETTIDIFHRSSLVRK
ncbi:unnamed protein product, partial [Protopolystoma xenopodis]